MAIATIGSQGTMGGLLIAGFLLKTVGWRVIAATGAIYGCVYLYERLTWTTKVNYFPIYYLKINLIYLMADVLFHFKGQRKSIETTICCTRH